MKKLIVLIIYFLLTTVCQAQWVQTNGPLGGSVHCIAVSGLYIFAGTEGYTRHGVYLSTNNGDSWTQTSFPEQDVLSLFVSGSNILAGTLSNGIYLSSDNGLNWTQTSLNNQRIFSMAAGSPALVAGTGGGVYISMNNGVNWVATPFINQTIYSVVVSGSYIFAGTYSAGVYISTNSGMTWTQTSLNNKNITALSVNGSNIFAGTGYNSNSGVYLSTNNGQSWVQTSLNTQNVYSLAVSGTNIYAGTGFPGNGVYLSTDNGTSWNQTSLNNRTVWALAASGTNIFAGAFGHGIYLSSNNGQTWLQTNMADQEIYSLAVSGSNIFAGVFTFFGFGPAYNGGVYKSTNNGATWVQTTFNNASVYSLAINGSNIFAATDGIGVYRSTDFGTTWAQASLALFMPIIFSVGVNGSNVFAGTYMEGIFTSTDNGDTWAQTQSSNIQPHSFAASGSNVFAGTVNGVFQSTDNGLSWAQTSLNNQNIQSIVINGSNIFAGTNGSGVFVSTDLGQSWTQTALNNQLVWSLVSYNTNVFAGTGGNGVYYSTNNGLTWVQYNQGMGNQTNRALALSTDYVFAGTLGSSVWSRPLVLQIPQVPVLLSPPNNITALPLTDTLHWNSLPNADSYRLQAATDAGFTNLVADDNNLTTGTKILTGLSPLTTYYWHVNAKNAAGTSNWSEVWNFKTIGTAGTLTLYNPPDNTINVPTTYTFRWSKAIDQTTHLLVSNYWFEMVSDTTTMANLLRDSTLTDTLRTVTGMNRSTSYYWRVKAKNQAGWSNFTSRFKFTTMPPAPSAPTLIAPANNSTMQSLTPLLDWSTVSGAESYQVLLSDDPGFATSIIDSSGFSADSIRITAGKLNYNTRYYWLVRAVNVGGTGSWSSVFNFTTDQFSLHTGLVAYYPFTGDAADSSGNKQDGTPVNASLATDRFGKPNSCYYFNGTNSYINVNHCNFYPSGAGPRTFTIWFKMANPGNDSLQSMLCYGSNSTGKRMQLAYNRASGGLVTEFNNGVNVVSWTPDTLWHLFAAVFPPGETTTNKFILYFDGSAISFTSPSVQTLNTDTVNMNIGEINTMANQYFHGCLDEIMVYNRALSAVEIAELYQHPLPVTLTSFSSAVNKNNITLNWCTELEVNNSGFKIERSVEKENWQSIAFINGNGTTNNPKNYSYTDKKLAPGTYKYRLKQIDYNGNLEYFALQKTVTISVPKKTGISQNYPNPFNPKSVIEYELSARSLVQIKIYDIIGREIKTLVNEMKDAGMYEVEWDASNYASGIYFYKITVHQGGSSTGDFTDTKKMLMVK